MASAFTQQVLAAMRQAEEDFGRSQQLKLAKTETGRRERQANLEELLARAGLLKGTAKGGTLDIPGMGATEIPGMEAQATMEAEAAGKRAEAVTAAQLKAQIAAQEQLSQKAITDARTRLKAAGVAEDSPDYNRIMAGALGVPEFLEIEIAGRKVKLPAKDAASLLERQYEAQAATGRTKMTTEASLGAARIGGESRLDVARISAESRLEAAKISAAKTGKPDAKTRENAASGIRALDKLEKLLETNPKILLKEAIPGAIGAREVRFLKGEVKDVLTRLRTGAALNEEEQSFYEGQLPGALDLTEKGVIKKKLALLRELFVRLSQGGTASLPNTQDDIDELP